MKVVLLPGLDGTGILSDSFIAQVPNGIDMVSIPLMQSSIGYQEQAKYILDCVGIEPYVLIAESYSGRVAYEMLKQDNEKIRHVVFVASFLTRPSWLATAARYMPISLVKNNLMPKLWVGKMLFERDTSAELVASFYRALMSVEDSVLSNRICQIAKLSKPNTPIKVPCTYIRPKSDKLVSKGAIEPFKSLCEDLTIKEVDGTHFVLQTHPEECWQIIQNIEAIKCLSHGD